LEELLIKYPDEPIASKRYAKIAKELGTRTLMQVQSRVQKYFIALKKEGLPVPGRDPKTAMLRNTRKRAYCNHVSASTKFMKAFDFGDSAEHNTELSSIMENEEDQSNTSKMPDPIRPR
ncbi:ZZ-type zinc finger-containing protein 3, partial [Armadillidium nasatum]